LVYNETGFLLESTEYIIKPRDFKIPRDAAAIHGITNEIANEHGRALNLVLNELRPLIEQASTLVAHNMAFDEKIVGAEFLRIGIPNPIEGKNKICTMLQTKNYVGIPGYYGMKWPTLDELHQCLFGVSYAEAHNAASDIKATAKCFWEAKRRGIIADAVARNRAKPQLLVLRFDGIYQSEKNRGYWHYIRLFDDGTALTTFSADDPTDLCNWLTKENQSNLANRGVFELEGRNIQFSCSGKEGIIYYNGIVEVNCLTLNFQSESIPPQRIKPFFFIPLE
jgi:DNA polymerase III epsilon subunit-like protein